MGLGQGEMGGLTHRGAVHMATARLVCKKMGSPAGHHLNFVNIQLVALQELIRGHFQTILKNEHHYDVKSWTPPPPLVSWQKLIVIPGLELRQWQIYM